MYVFNISHANEKQTEDYASASINKYINEKEILPTSSQSLKIYNCEKEEAGINKENC